MVWFAKSKGMADIIVPKTILKVDAIPLLGTGMVDLKGAQDLGARLMNLSADKPAPQDAANLA